MFLLSFSRPSEKYIIKLRKVKNVDLVFLSKTKDYFSRYHYRQVYLKWCEIDVLWLRFVPQYHARPLTEICQQTDNVRQYCARRLTEICQQIDNVRHDRARHLTEIWKQIDNVRHDRALRLTEICHQIDNVC